MFTCIQFETRLRTHTIDHAFQSTENNNSLLLPLLLLSSLLCRCLFFFSFYSITSHLLRFCVCVYICAHCYVKVTSDRSYCCCNSSSVTLFFVLFNRCWKLEEAHPFSRCKKMWDKKKGEWHDMPPIRIEKKRKQYHFLLSIFVCMSYIACRRTII